MFYTDLINQMALDDKDRLSIFDKNSPYLATKKVGKNNPKEQTADRPHQARQKDKDATATIASFTHEPEVI